MLNGFLLLLLLEALCMSSEMALEMYFKLIFTKSGFSEHNLVVLFAKSFAEITAKDTYLEFTL